MKIKAKQQRQARFWRKFLRLTRGRVSVIRALEVIGSEEQHKPFRDLLLDMKQDLNKGSTLSEAVGKHPGVFSASVHELVASAEKTGAWDEVLQEIADGLSDGTFD